MIIILKVNKFKLSKFSKIYCIVLSILFFIFCIFITKGEGKSIEEVMIGALGYLFGTGISILFTTWAIWSVLKLFTKKAYDVSIIFVVIFTIGLFQAVSTEIKKKQKNRIYGKDLKIENADDMENAKNEYMKMINNYKPTSDKDKQGTEYMKKFANKKMDIFQDFMVLHTEIVNSDFLVYKKEEYDNRINILNLYIQKAENCMREDLQFEKLILDTEKIYNEKMSKKERNRLLKNDEITNLLIQECIKFGNNMIKTIDFMYKKNKTEKDYELAKQLYEALIENDKNIKNLGKQMKELYGIK